ncbi:MAG: response regulator [Verrucomicrobiae bacterium]|nr:response regulator [Verrucomicrobiae bacterium]
MSRPPQKTILIVEDETDVSRLLEYHLRRRGYQTTVAADGLDGLNTALRHPPDLILLDLMLPKMHGFEVCRLLKRSPLTRRVPILVLSAMSGTQDKLMGFDLGAEDYMTKPFEMAELLARVQALLMRH